MLARDSKYKQAGLLKEPAEMHEEMHEEKTRLNLEFGNVTIYFVLGGQTFPSNREQPCQVDSVKTDK